MVEDLLFVCLQWVYIVSLYAFKFIKNKQACVNFWQMWRKRYPTFKNDWPLNVIAAAQHKMMRDF